MYFNLFKIGHLNRGGIEITSSFQLVKRLETESEWLWLNHKTVGIWKIRAFAQEISP